MTSGRSSSGRPSWSTSSPPDPDPSADDRAHAGRGATGGAPFGGAPVRPAESGARPLVDVWHPGIDRARDARRARCRPARHHLCPRPLARAGRLRPLRRHPSNRHRGRVLVGRHRLRVLVARGLHPAHACVAAVRLPPPSLPTQGRALARGAAQGPRCAAADHPGCGSADHQRCRWRQAGRRLVGLVGLEDRPRVAARRRRGRRVPSRRLATHLRPRGTGRPGRPEARRPQR